jgi:hypothetical protein
VLLMLKKSHSQKVKSKIASTQMTGRLLAVKAILRCWLSCKSLYCRSGMAV